MNIDRWLNVASFAIAVAGVLLALNRRYWRLRANFRLKMLDRVLEDERYLRSAFFTSLSTLAYGVGFIGLGLALSTFAVGLPFIWTIAVRFGASLAFGSGLGACTGAALDFDFYADAFSAPERLRNRLQRKTK